MPKPTPAKSPSTAAVPVNRSNAEHYRWGVDCDAWHLLKCEDFTVIEELIPPGAAEVMHYHKKSQQFFFVLSGEALMKVDGDTVMLPAGNGLRILPGTRHQIRNPSSSPMRLLVISQPPSHGDKHTD